MSRKDSENRIKGLSEIIKSPARSLFESGRRDLMQIFYFLLVDENIIKEEIKKVISVFEKPAQNFLSFLEGREDNQDADLRNLMGRAISEMKKLTEGMSYKSAFLRNLVINYGSIFEKYLLEITKEILEVKPLLMGGDSSISLNDLINLGEDEVIVKKINTYTRNLSNGGYYETVKQIAKTLKLSDAKIFQFSGPQSKEFLQFFNELRNIIVHCNSSGDKRFIHTARNAGIDCLNEGDSIKTPFAFIVTLNLFIDDLIRIIDFEVFKKYHDSHPSFLEYSKKYVKDDINLEEDPSSVDSTLDLNVMFCEKVKR